jgi:serine/threonine protein kinase/tetratricopeptide (TPR) repeat protein
MNGRKLFKYNQYSQGIHILKAEMSSLERVQIANYLLEQKLGSGGMGQVWKAIDNHLARPVALKLLPNNLLLNDEARERFLREARAASVLNHPNIVTIFDTGEHDQQLYIAMELIDGVTVREIIYKGDRSLERILDIMKQTLMGLAAAHQAGIIHRDIKPENLMVRKDGYVKILDFGLAKIQVAGDIQLTPTSEVIGTPKYMSPEQIKKEPVDGRSDLFSLGAVFYEMISGVSPFSGESLHQVLTSIISMNPPPLKGVPPELAKTVMKALQKDKERRYRDATEFLSDIVLFTGGSLEIPGAVTETSMAILPFTCAPEDVVLSDGIVDEVIANLSRVSKIRIIASSTSKYYRNHTMTIPEIGQALNVDIALEGSMRRSGDRIRVTAQLVNTRDGFQMWNGRFDVKVKDIFDMEDEISGAIVQELNKHFVSLESLEVRPASLVIDSKTSELYFKGVSIHGTLRIDDVKKAVQYFYEVIEIEPGFATAHAKLSIALANLHRLLQPDPPAGILEKAESEARKALQLDASSPDAYVSLAIVAKNKGDFASAIKHLNAALDIAPSHVPALSWLSYVRSCTGHPQDAEALARKAIERDPAGSAHYTFLGYSLISQGRFMEAADALDRALRVDPRNHYSYAILLLSKLAMNNMKEGRSMFDYLARSRNLPLQVHMIMALYRQIAESPAELPISPDLLRKIAYEPEAELLAADIFALRGEISNALKYLESAVNKGFLNLDYLQNDPFLKPLHGAQGFVSLKEFVKNAIRKYGKVSGEL